MKRALVLLVLLSVLFVLVIPHVLAGGPINIPGYCAAQGKGAPYSQGRDWYCGGSSFNLSMDEVCRWQYGSDSRAVNADYTNANGWSCEGGSSSGNTGGGGTSSGGGSTGSPLNMSGYCSSRGLGAPYTSGRDWFCGGSSFSVSPDEVCRWQGGGSAVSNNVMDPNSWRCGGSGGGYVPPVNSNPVVQPTAVPQSNPVTSGGSSSSLATREWWGSVNPPTSGEYIQVRESGLRVRQFPGTDQAVLGVVRQWDYYPLFEIRGDWGLITGTYGSGWVHLGYVEVFRWSEPQMPSVNLTFPYETAPTIAFISGYANVDWREAENRFWTAASAMWECGLVAVDIAAVFGIVTGSATIATPPGQLVFIISAAILTRVNITTADQLASCAFSAMELSELVVEIIRGE